MKEPKERSLFETFLVEKDGPGEAGEACEGSRGLAYLSPPRTEARDGKLRKIRTTAEQILRLTNGYRVSSRQLRVASPVICPPQIGQKLTTAALQPRTDAGLGGTGLEIPLQPC